MILVLCLLFWFLNRKYSLTFSLLRQCSAVSRNFRKLNGEKYPKKKLGYLTQKNYIRNSNIKSHKMKSFLSKIISILSMRRCNRCQELEHDCGCWFPDFDD